MEVHESRSGDVLVVAAEGHLDTAHSMAFEDRLVRLIENGERRMLIDCGKLEYVNSSGLKAFLIAAKRLDAVGGKFALCQLAPNVKMIFDMIGFSKILTIAPTREEALGFFAATGAPA